MMRAAARDPIWSVAHIVFSPLALGVWLAKAIAVLIPVALVLFFGVEYAVIKISRSLASSSSAITNAAMSPSHGFFRHPPTFID